MTMITEDKKAEHAIAGKTVLLDMYDVKLEVYYPTFHEKFLQIIRDAGMHVLKDDVFHWPNTAFTLSVILEESSCVAEWWPEHKYMAVSIYTCGKAEPMNIAKALGEWLRPEYEQVEQYIRGVRP